MNKCRNTLRQVQWPGLMLLVCLAFFPACSQSVPGELLDHITDIELAFSQDTDIIFYDTFGLFTTTVVIPYLDKAINSFNLDLLFDNNLVGYVSILSDYGYLKTKAAPGVLNIKAYGVTINAGENVEICAITWKATATGITDITLKANKIKAGDGLAVNTKVFTSTIRILKEIGTLSIEGESYIEVGTAFTKPVVIDSRDKMIKEYDFNILFDASKISADTTIGNTGIMPGADGFINTVTAGDGVINITGTSSTGANAGENLEFLLTNWIAVGTGRAVIKLEINKLVTTDNVYIKPEIRTATLSLYSGTAKPTVEVRLVPGIVNVNVNSVFTTSVFLNITSYVLAAYGIDFYYDNTVLELDKSQANGKGIMAGADGFLTVVNTPEPGGIIRAAGFDLKGKAPNAALELLKIYWKAIGVAQAATIDLATNDLSDIRSREIGRFRDFDCMVTVNP